MPNKNKAEELRSRAEQCLAEQHVVTYCEKEATACKLMHELQVYNLELEMQNEQLLVFNCVN